PPSGGRAWDARRNAAVERRSDTRPSRKRDLLAALRGGGKTRLLSGRTRGLSSSHGTRFLQHLLPRSRPGPSLQFDDPGGGHIGTWGIRTLSETSCRFPRRWRNLDSFHDGPARSLLSRRPHSVGP